MPPFWSRFSLTPSFPEYSGPFPVGTVDIELPTAELRAPCPVPNPSITTVCFRIFYPAESSSEIRKPVHWLPEPQREYLGAYARFLGTGSRTSEILSYVPLPLRQTAIPAIRDAKVLKPTTKTKRWPVLIFSHGLGGTRNAYSQLLGSLASYGLVVVTPEHRDGSTPITFIRQSRDSKGEPIYYKEISLKPSKDAFESRDQQLSIRLWELGMVYEALLRIDRGEVLPPVSEDVNDISDHSILPMFTALLDIHTPGKVSWSGHSFGAATVVQFVKSIFYRSLPIPSASGRPLYSPSEDSSIIRQITPSTVVSLLDLWAFPLESASTTWLKDKPLPCYESGGPGGSHLLVILSEAFFKWKGNLLSTKRAVSADPSLSTPPDTSFPHVFYATSSAHLSQSDFGVLFPWLTKRFLKAQEPERTLRLNFRAILEVLRQAGIEVSRVLEIESEELSRSGQPARTLGKSIRTHPTQDIKTRERTAPHQSFASEVEDDKILGTDGSIRGWIALDLQEENSETEAANQETPIYAAPSQAVAQGELKKTRDPNEKL